MPAIVKEDTEVGDEDNEGNDGDSLAKRGSFCDMLNG